MTDQDLPSDLLLAGLRYLNKNLPDRRQLRLTDIGRWLPGRALSSAEIGMLLTYLTEHGVEFIDE